MNGGEPSEKEKSFVSSLGARREVKRASPRVKQLSALLSGNGSNPGLERQVPVDVPKYRFGRPDEFERPWHIGLWAPNDVGGPYVVINSQSPEAKGDASIAEAKARIEATWSKFQSESGRWAELAKDQQATFQARAQAQAQAWQTS